MWQPGIGNAIGLYMSGRVQDNGMLHFSHFCDIDTKIMLCAATFKMLQTDCYIAAGRHVIPLQSNAICRGGLYHIAIKCHVLKCYVFASKTMLSSHLSSQDFSNIMV